MSHAVDPAQIEAFNRLANDAAVVIGDEVMSLAEQYALVSTTLPVGSTYYAVVSGATSAALRVLKAAGEAGLLTDADEGFRKLLLQMTDIWGQIAGDVPGGSTVQ